MGATVRSWFIAASLSSVLSVVGCTPGAQTPDVMEAGMVVDTGPDTGPDRCGAAMPALRGLPVSPTTLTTDAPAPTGGTIMAGTYELTAINRYPTAMRPQSYDAATIAIDGEFWDFTFGMNGIAIGASKYRRTATTPLPDASVSTSLTFSGRCDTTTGLGATYTASATTLKLTLDGSEGIELIFTRR